MWFSPMLSNQADMDYFSNDIESVQAVLSHSLQKEY